MAVHLCLAAATSLALKYALVLSALFLESLRFSERNSYLLRSASAMWSGLSRKGKPDIEKSVPPAARVLLSTFLTGPPPDEE